jgi:tRNA(fMet)-specific endonuclease VapC
MKYLLDTDMCIEILRGNQKVIEQARQCTPEEIAISSITRYELLYGVARCAPARREREKAKVKHFLSALHELPFSSHTAAHAAAIRQELEQMGQPIGPLDILIAASAFEARLELITGNLAEFSRIRNLTCRSWL